MKIQLGSVWHFSLAVENPENSAQFWTKNFELQEMFRSDEVVALTNDAMIIGFFKGTPHPDTIDHLSFRLDSMHALREALETLKEQRRRSWKIRATRSAPHRRVRRIGACGFTIPTGIAGSSRSKTMQEKIDNVNRLIGKTAVITGGATGIGRAAAKRFIDEGAFVFIFGRRQEALDAAVAELGPKARAVKGSVCDLADLDRLYAAVKAERGTLDIVFANAGAGSQLPLGKITAEHIDETFDTNVKGSIFTVQKALPLMGQGGSIILTGSSAGTTGAPGMSAYSASKAAVRNLARTWAQDLKGTGIRVNVLSPGATATELAKEALGEEGQKVYASMTPLQRMADPSEIAAAAAFLASSDSSFMTASEVAVDGGLAQL